MVEAISHRREDLGSEEMETETGEQIIYRSSSHPLQLLEVQQVLENMSFVCSISQYFGL